MSHVLVTVKMIRRFAAMLKHSQVDMPTHHQSFTVLRRWKIETDDTICRSCGEGG
jgi:hypothetical protein